MMQMDTNGAWSIKPNVWRGYEINKIDTIINKMYNPPPVSLYGAEYTRNWYSTTAGHACMWPCCAACALYVVVWNISIHYKTWAHTSYTLTREAVSTARTSGWPANRGEERNPSFAVWFWVAAWYVSHCCLWMNDCYDNGPGRSSVGLKRLDAPMPDLIWDSQPSSPSLQLLPIWAQHLYGAGHLHNYEYQQPWPPSARWLLPGLPLCVWFMWLCRSLLLITGWECDRSILNQVWFSVTEL